MELSAKLKKRPSFPFETIAVAIAFSPRLEALLSESKRIADRLRASLILVHVGVKTDEKVKRLDKLIDKLNIDVGSTRIIWSEGEAVETILKLCKLNVVDLLIMGANKKDSLLKYYLGSVARKISRNAKCSVLLLTHPGEQETKPARFVVNGIENPKTIHTINAAVYVANHFEVKEITVVKEVSTPALEMAIADDNTAREAREIKKSIAHEDEKKLKKVTENILKTEIPVSTKIVKGKPGFAISKYAKDKKADLLVINSPDTHLNLIDRIFTHDIEYILADLPCNLLIVHSRI